MRILLLLTAIGCNGSDFNSQILPPPSAPTDDDTGVIDESDDTGSVNTEEAVLSGWIGSPCTTDADCDYTDGVCLPEGDGFPGGTCSQTCASTCPDEDGYPITACIDDAELPASVPDEDGSCLSRCDFGLYASGCRSGYGCAQASRPADGQTDAFVCLPDRQSDIGECREELLARGVGFTPTIQADSHPDDHPELTCHIEDAVWLSTPVFGVDLRYYYSDDPDSVLVDCETAHAIADTADDIGPLGVVELVHVGTYSCRVISGTSSLSQHGLGRALDINGFIFEDGSSITVYDDWEDGDDTPESWGGLFMYEAVNRWYDAWIWNVILTPEYNEAHDNHFHVDMTDGSHTLQVLDGRYIGPALGEMD